MRLLTWRAERSGSGVRRLPRRSAISHPTRQNLSVARHIVDMLVNGRTTGNINEATGYIPTAAEANDPRFEMALTVDIKPGAIGKNANKLLLNTDSQGHPQELRPDGVVKRMMKEYLEFKNAN